MNATSDFYEYSFSNPLILKLQSFENGSAESLKTRHAALDPHGALFGNLPFVWN
jgi:hypothetical protein